MRVVVVVILLAGCSGPPAHLEPEGPLHGAALGPAPLPMHITDGGDLSNGLSAQWNWSTDPRAVSATVSIHALGPGAGGMWATQLTDIRVTLMRNGTTHDEGGVNGLRGSIGTGPVVIYSWEAEPDQLAKAGEWVLRMDAGAHPQVTYTMQVDVIYDERQLR